MKVGLIEALRFEEIDFPVAEEGERFARKRSKQKKRFLWVGSEALQLETKGKRFGVKA